MHPLSSRVPDSLKPGMKHVVVSGETLNVVDNTGDSLTIVCKEHQGVMRFLIAFDEHRTARAANAPSMVMDRLAANLSNAWASLPDHVRRELPSSRLIGLRLPT